MEFSEAYEKITVLRAALEGVIRGKREIIDLSISALLAKGHLLMEDVPGVGKTTLAHGLARSINCSFQRIQFTSDLLPSDCIGVTVYNAKTNGFEFRQGPIFANIVLADEINRATPKTQSALLEAMNDRQVSVDGVTYPLPGPFMLLATQNPMEFAGTFPLPESQLDRFTMSVRIGYPSRLHEIEILKSAPSADVLKSLAPVVDVSEVMSMQALVERVRIEDDLIDYILRIAEATRGHKKIRLGISPRGTAALYKTAQAYAIISGRNYCLPDDVKRLAVPVFAHRIIPSGSGIEESALGAADVVEEILSDIDVPV